ncbi:MAG: hypothetical protein JXR94_08925, partial [Candidatus Hydrogenedentes bacterium]|nr:hypothetical protein [Candidatus Hydrogenedentota bacterium]
MVREKFIPYLEGEARLTERLCVEVHITYCYHCREELDELRELLASSRAAIRHPHPTDRFDLLMERIARNEAAVQAASPQRRWRWRDHAVRLAVAAGIVIAVGASSPFLLHSTRGIAPRQNTPAPVNNAAAYSA